MRFQTLLTFTLCQFFGSGLSQQEPDTLSFPEGFLFGVASSAYQTEGAWNESGKGLNVWDHYLHAYPDMVKNEANGDVACDSYHKFKEDVALIKNLGVDFYRFSISWSRILPYGYVFKINPDGIRFYNELIDELLKNGIKPVVTMYHWDLPLGLQKIGGWANKQLTNLFADYARILFENFGDRVPYWITFNSGCGGYADKDFPPIINQPGVADYLCMHSQLLAHAKVYRMYEAEFKSTQKGKVGITMDPRWYHPKTDSDEDLEATERARQFSIGWFGHPLFSKEGDYPKVMRERISERSKLEKFPNSRLPQLTPEQIETIKGASDFLGINVYTTFLVNAKPEEPIGGPNYLYDVGVEFSQDPKWPKSAASWLRVVPSGVGTLLRWLKANYGNIPIFITENGYSDDGSLEDHQRIHYYESYLSAILEAIHEDEVNVMGYAMWSLLDNFEWTAGYTQKFGLYKVDFDDPDRTRTPKLSVDFYKEITRLRKLTPRKKTGKDEL